MSKYTIKSFEVDFQSKFIKIDIDGFNMQWINIKKGVLSVKKSQGINVLKHIDFKNFFDDVMKININEGIKSINDNNVDYKYSKFEYVFFNGGDYSFKSCSDSYIEYTTVNNVAADIQKFKHELKSIFNEYFNQ